MKEQTNPLVGLIIGFLASIFFGIIVFSIGLGAAFPSINKGAKPFVCLQGELTFEKNVSQPMPGETYATIQWYCTDAGERIPLDYSSIFLPAGILYGVIICFPLFLLARYLFKRWDKSLEQKYASERSKKRK